MYVFRISMRKYLQTHLKTLGETVRSFVQPLKWDIFPLIRRKISGCEMYVSVFLSSYGICFTQGEMCPRMLQ